MFYKFVNGNYLIGPRSWDNFDIKKLKNYNNLENLEIVKKKITARAFKVIATKWVKILQPIFVEFTFFSANTAA